MIASHSFEYSDALTLWRESCALLASTGLGIKVENDPLTSPYSITITNHVPVPLTHFQNLRTKTPRSPHTLPLRHNPSTNSKPGCFSPNYSPHTDLQILSTNDPVDDVSSRRRRSSHHPRLGIIAHLVAEPRYRRFALSSRLQIRAL